MKEKDFDHAISFNDVGYPSTKYICKFSRQKVKNKLAQLKCCCMRKKGNLF